MKDNKIQEIKIYYDTNSGMPIKLVYERENEVRTIKRSADEEKFVRVYNKVMKEAKDDYKVESIDDLYEKGIIKDIKAINTKLGNFVISKKLLALLTAGAVVLVGTGIYGIVKSNKKDSNKDEKVIENTIDLEQSTAISDIPVLTEPTIESIIEEPIVEEPIVEEPIIEEFEPIIVYEDLTYNGKIPHDLNEDYDLIYLANETWRVLNGIADHMVSSEYTPNLESSPKLVHLETLYSNSTEKVILKHFCDISNQIIEAAYIESDFDKVVNKVKFGSYEIIRCIGNNEPVVSNDNSYYYQNMAEDAKELLLKMAYGICSPLLNEKVEYNGVNYNVESVSNIIINANENIMKTR